MTADRPMLGILLMFGFCLLAPIGDSLAKVLGATIPLVMLIFVRFSVQVAILVPLVVAAGGTFRMSRRVIGRLALRTVLHVIGIGAMFASLRFLPLADAVAIAFVMPFIMLLLGRYVLNEEVGPRRLIACAVGFIGTLLVIQPSFAEVGAPALLPLLVAVVFALFMLVTRTIAKEVDPMAMQAVSGAMASFGLAVVLLFGGTLHPDLGMVVPDSREMVLLFTIGAVGTVAHLLMTWSLRYAPSATLAPMQYLEIPIATIVGWIVFSDLPNGLSAIGILITMASGLYIVLRERAVARMATRVAPPAV